MNPADSLFLTTVLALIGAVTLGFSLRKAYGFGMLSGLGLMLAGLKTAMNSFGNDVFSPNMPVIFGYLAAKALASSVFYGMAAD